VIENMAADSTFKTANKRQQNSAAISKGQPGKSADGQARSIALALQGGGSHGAFTWGVLDRLLDEIEAGSIKIGAISGASAGAINAALLSSGLAIGGADVARRKLRDFWSSVSRRGFFSGNPLFGFAEPSPFGGWNIDWSPIAIWLEMVGLVVSPYANPFYTDSLRPLLDEAFPPSHLQALNGPEAPRLFLSATAVHNDQRKIFVQPNITTDVLRASACLPTEFRAVPIERVPYWDGGYLGNPPLSPLIDVVDELFLVLVNPLLRRNMPPTNARAILDRLNEITFNSSVVLEINAIETVNGILAGLKDAGLANPTKYRPIRFHYIHNDAFLGNLGFVSKNSTSWDLLSKLFDEGRKTADVWWMKHHHQLGHESSCNVREELVKPLLHAQPPVHAGPQIVNAFPSRDTVNEISS
jgi:NTE family protein